MGPGQPAGFQCPECGSDQFIAFTSPRTNQSRPKCSECGRIIFADDLQGVPIVTGKSPARLPVLPWGIGLFKTLGMLLLGGGLLLVLLLWAEGGPVIGSGLTIAGLLFLGLGDIYSHMFARMDEQAAAVRRAIALLEGNQRQGDPEPGTDTRQGVS